ncbi:MAG: hypothetical protein NT069_17790, partial [Planctomycetota bacterium]|nr:hypothetical protein [Planctomycetota bacterium]
MRTPRRATLITVVGVALLLAADASYRATIPGVNEPHYLSKARHFWIDTWCQRDLFAASANAHWFFYAAVGWLAAVFPFPVAAWLGRIAGWSVLAWGWNRLGKGLIGGESGRLPTVEGRCAIETAEGRTLEGCGSTAAPCTPNDPRTHSGGSAGASPSRGEFLDTVGSGMRFQLPPVNWSIVFAAILWMAFAVPNGLSGEWVIGGVESKVFAYGLLFAGLGNLLQHRLRWAGLQLGLSVSFHPLVGGWGVVALVLSLGCDRVRLAICRRRGLCADRSPHVLPPEAVDTPADQQNHAGLFAILLLIVASLPGMIPAVAMLANVPSREIADHGTRIQVLDRLPHHLLPGHFRPQDAQWSGALMGVFLLGCWLGPRTTSWRLWRGVILGCAGIALAGLLADLTPWRISLLKFYPFRLIVGLLPCAAAWELIALWPAVRRKIERGILLLTN